MLPTFTASDPAPEATPDAGTRHRDWRRRQLRRATAFVVLPGVVLGLCTLSGAYAAGAFAHHSQHAPLGRTPKPRNAFSVRVLNGSGRNGLARSAAAQLRRQGFTVTFVGDAPELAWRDDSAIVWHGRGGAEQARLVAAQIPGSHVAQDQRDGTGVEVILGTAFTRISEPPRS